MMFISEVAQPGLLLYSLVFSFALHSRANGEFVQEWSAPTPITPNRCYFLANRGSLLQDQMWMQSRPAAVMDSVNDTSPSLQSNLPLITPVSKIPYRIICPPSADLCFSAFGTVQPSNKTERQKLGDHFSTYGCVDHYTKQQLASLFEPRALEKIQEALNLARQQFPGIGQRKCLEFASSVRAAKDVGKKVDATFCFCSGDSCNDGSMLESEVKAKYKRQQIGKAQKIEELEEEREREEKPAPREPQIFCQRRFWRIPHPSSMNSTDDQEEMSMPEENSHDSACPRQTKYCFYITGSQQAFPHDLQFLMSRSGMGENRRNVSEPEQREIFAWRGCFSPRTQKFLSRVHNLQVSMDGRVVLSSEKQSAISSISAENATIEQCYAFKISFGIGTICLCKHSKCLGTNTRLVVPTTTASTTTETGNDTPKNSTFPLSSTPAEKPTIPPSNDIETGNFIEEEERALPFAVPQHSKDRAGRIIGADIGANSAEEYEESAFRVKQVRKEAFNLVEESSGVSRVASLYILLLCLVAVWL